MFLHAALFSSFVNLLLLVPALYMVQVFDRVLSSRSGETLLLLSAAAVGALILMMVMDMLRSRLLLAASAAMEKLLAPSVVGGLMREARQVRQGDYVGGMRDLGVLRTFLTGPAILALFDAPWLVVYLLVVFLFHPLLGAVATAGAIALLALAWVNERATRASFDASQNESRQAAGLIEAGLRQPEVVGALGMAGNLTQRWQHASLKSATLAADAHRAAVTIGGLSKFLRQLLQILMVAVGAYLVLDQHVTAGVMMAGTILLSRALAPVETLISGWRTLTDAQAAYRRLDALVTANDPDAVPTELPAITGGVRVDKVVCGAPGSNRAILKGVSFDAAPGEAIGIIGPSGSGKSTLARVLVGAWLPASGCVRLDGADIAQWSRDRLGPQLGYLPDDIGLFDARIASNIARLGACDPEDVITAAKRANAHDMILRLPQGYDTVVGEGGRALSGGQRQRVGLARALFGQPRIVVLDEPDSHLDGEGEDALVRALHALKADGVTVFVIAQRASLIAHMDKVLVLNDGVVEMFGPRAEVVARVTRGSVPQSVPVASQGPRRVPA
jgi:PrtD family type I secretion system ABC transporter